MSSNTTLDPLEEHRLRLEQAEREARGDFSHSNKSTAQFPPTPTGLNKSSGAPTTTTTASSLATHPHVASHPTDHPPLKKEDSGWLKYNRDASNEDDQSPAAILNRQHNNLRAQAAVDQSIMGLLDVSLPREEGRM